MQKLQNYMIWNIDQNGFHQRFYDGTKRQYCHIKGVLPTDLTLKYVH